MLKYLADIVIEDIAYIYSYRFQVFVHIGYMATIQQIIPTSMRPERKYTSVQRTKSTTK